MAKPIAIAILANGKQAAREFDSLGSKAAKWGKRVAAAGAVAAVALAKTVVDAASDAEQSLGATEQIFGKYADTVIKRSNQAANAIGLSANEYRELSNVTGAMLKSSGMPLQRVTDLTDKLNRRAADMAATFGGTTKEAVEAVSSLLRGEADPIERYGVSIKQSDVNARLAAKGLDKLTGNAKKTAEQQARLDLLFKQSKDSAGQFARESDTLAGKQQRLAAKIENVKVRVGNVLLPAFTKAADLANKHLVPALERMAEWLENNSDEIAAFGKGIGRYAIPALKTLTDLATKAAKWLADLPGPVKEVGVQAGIAALILPRLTAAATATAGAFTTATARTKQFYAELTYAETRAQRTTAVMGKLGGAAKAAAGIAGMLALSEGARQTDKTLGTLMTTAGGAATGFAVGGPWGAAIGGAAGLLGGLLTSTKKANEGFKDTKPPTDYAASLDEISGAATKATREVAILALEQAGAFEKAKSLGITRRDLVGALLEEEGALKRVNGTLEANQTETRWMVDQYGRLGETYVGVNQNTKELTAILGENTAAFRDQRREVRDDIMAMQDLSELRGKIPKNIYTHIESTGIRPTLRGIAKVTGRYNNLDGKQIKAIMDVVGVEGTVKQVKKAEDRLKAADKTKVTLKGWVEGIDTATKKGARYSDKESKTIVTKLESIKKAHPKLAPYVDGVRTGVVNATGEANKSTQVGNQLKNGLLSGMYGTGTALSIIMSGAVRQAIAAARREAAIKSPSRKTAAIGRNLGLGFVIGMQRTSRKVKVVGRKLLGNALAGIAGGRSGIDKALGKVTKRIEKRITGKNEKKREKRVLKALKDEYKALRKNGKQQDKNNRKLDKAKNLLEQRVQAAKDHAAAIKSTILAYGSITALEEGHLNSPRSLVDQMTSRVEAAERFADLIGQLTGKLNKTSLQELIDRGVEGGMAAAEALVAGGKSTIDEVNVLQGRLEAVGTDLGKTATQQFHQAGIDAAQGLVNGLLKQEKKLDKAAKKLAKKLVKAVKKELGIKSPSRVGKDLGKNFAGSIDLGTNVVPLHATGRHLARDLVRGFGEPTMTARAAWEATRDANATTPTLNAEINLTAEQLSAVEQGRRIKVNLNAYHRAGGRIA